MYQLDNQKLWLEILGCIEAINKAGFDVRLTWAGYGIVSLQFPTGVENRVEDYRDMDRLLARLQRFIEDYGVLTDGTPT